MGYVELLRAAPGFRRLWLGQVVSECGDWLQFVALLELFPSGGEAALPLAMLFLVRILPWILWAPIAGVVADRLPRGRVMIAADLLRALVVLGYLLVDGPGDVGLVYLLSFLHETLSSFFEPARSASIPNLVPRSGLLAANSLAGATWSAALAFGSALGGAIAVTLGARAAFLLDALSFVISALILATVRVPPAPPREGAAPAKHDRLGLAALREGARYLATSGPQAAAALAKGLWGFSMGYIMLLSLYAGQVFTPPGESPSAANSVLYAGRGVGALVGPLVAKRLVGDSARALRRSIQVGFPLAAVTLALFTRAPDEWTGALLLVVGTGGGSIVWVASTQLIQLSVPNALQGRVFSVDYAANMLAMSLSNTLAGVTISAGWIGIHGGMLGMAGAAVVASLAWALAMRRVGARLDAATGGAGA
jgi:MFS family permease